MERKILISAPRHIQNTKILHKFLLLVAPVNWMYPTALNFKWVLNLQEVFLNCKCAENFKWIMGGKSCAVGFTIMHVTHIVTASTEMQKNSSLPNLSLTASTSPAIKTAQNPMISCSTNHSQSYTKTVQSFPRVGSKCMQFWRNCLRLWDSKVIQILCAVWLPFLQSVI